MEAIVGVTLQFSRMNDLGSDFIRLYDHGSWSHVDNVLPDGSLLGARDDTCGGKPEGVQIRPDGYLPFTATKRVVLMCTTTQSDVWLSFIQAQIGKPYDETAIAGFVLNRDWRRDDSWFCSELACAALETSKIFPFPLAAQANKVTPDDLFLVASALVNVW
jgi:hypothetical protein